MMTGAKIVLDTGMDAARAGLAGLAGVEWMMSLPQRRGAYASHPAGTALPGRLPADGGAGLVAVAFGDMEVPTADHVVVPVRWEPVEPGDEYTVRLDGSLTLAPATEEGHCALTLTGICQVLPGTVTAAGREQVRLEFMEASLEFVTSVARDLTSATGPGPEHDGLGPSWAW
jgi:hypothetical protein